MCGPIGSGKSYVAESLYRHLPKLNPDDFMPKHQEWTRQGSNAAWDEVHTRIRKFSELNLEFVVDSAQALEVSRRRLCQYIREVAPQYDIVCVFVKTPFDQCMQRNATRERTVSGKQLKEYYNNIMDNPPSRADGYDKVVVVDNATYKGNNVPLWETKDAWPEKWYYA